MHQNTRNSYRQKPKSIGISFNDFAIAPMAVALELILCLLAVGCHVQPGTLPHIGGNATDVGAVAERLRTITSAGTPAESHSANLIDDRQNAQKVYEALQYAPGWVREGQATPQALAVISALQNSQQKGLNPEDYQASLWPARLIALKAGSGNADAVAQFDAALTVCALRYLSNLRIGRVNPKPSEFGIDLDNHHYDLPQFLVQKVLTASDLPDILSKVEPQYLGYQRTEAALHTYLTLASQDHSNPLPDPQP